MIPWSQDFYCAACDERFNEVIEKAARGDPHKCPECGEPAPPVFAVPRPLRASHHDGVRRKGFAELHEAAKLEADSFDIAPVERGPINREIKKLRKSDGKGGVT